MRFRRTICRNPAFRPRAWLVLPGLVLPALVLLCVALGLTVSSVTGDAGNGRPTYTGTADSPAGKYRLGKGTEMEVSGGARDISSRGGALLSHTSASFAPRSNEDGWVTIFSDDFESGFPGTNWDVWRPEDKAQVDWDVWSCWHGDSPDNSAGCAAGGPLAIGCAGLYPNNMDSWIVYGPFSLADPGIVAAEFSFKFGGQISHKMERIKRIMLNW